MTLSKDAVLGLIALALAGAYYAGATQIQASLLSDAVGADGVPRVLAWGMAAVGAGLLLRGLVWRRKTEEDDETLPLRHHVRALALLGMLIAYLVLTPVLGYPVTVALLLGSVSWFAGARPGTALAATALLGAGFFWVMFTWALGIPMPAGFF
ncbi:MAG: tripartite tricarboxylate transporter TctB family protein [Rhodospirillaceae bacterium]|nr:tripartite tricarboxylate transporter TctB family protein [Rhodospirillaceae bacterium]